jgi:hypothetical protein
MLAANGCETNLNTNISNCGSCGYACPTRANATIFCAASTCGFSCTSGWGNCDGNAVNGCETYLNTSINNCGSCGHVCGTGQSCVAGVCQ